MNGFRVVASEVVQQQLRNLAAVAAEQGRVTAFHTAYDVIVDRLQRDPTEFGEPRYELRHLSLEMRRAAVAPLFVSYGVNRDHRFVVIQAFALMVP